MRVERLLDAKAEAISLAEARRHCRILGTDDDDDLRDFIASARRHVEHLTQNAIVEGEYAFYFDSFQPSFKIHNPIVSIISIEYKTTENIGTYAGSLTTAGYHFNAGQGLITLADDAMDDLHEQSNAIKITAKAGQPNIGIVPDDIKLAMRLMIGHWMKEREETSLVKLYEIPMGAAALLAPYRAYSL